MNKKHAEEILKVIAEFLAQSNVVYAGSLLFDDERTLKGHIAAALAGKQ